MPLPAALYVPDFLRKDEPELRVIFDALRDPLVGYLYDLILMQSNFADGHFLSSYARLMELCTPPKPERGRRRPGPTLKQLRNAIDDMERFGLLRRGETNQAQGQLRLWVTPRKKERAPMQSEGRILGRVRKAKNPAMERPTEVQAADLGQDKGQGYQGVNTLHPPPLLKPATYPQPKPTKAQIAGAKALLEELKSSPPGGGKRKAPPGGIGTTDVPY